MTRPWRLLLDPAAPGALNMGRDLAILEAVAQRAVPPTVRLYGWSPPCLSLGRHQPTEAADLDFCRHRGIDVVRRPTGGRAVLHDVELTYATVASLGEGRLPRNLQQAYRVICAGLVKACRRLGIEAELTPGEVNLQLLGPRSVVPCFKAPAGGEVVVRGRKLIGSAMRRYQGTILQHGAVLLDWDGELQAGAVGLADDSSLRPFVTTVAAELGRIPPLGTLREAMAAGIAETLGVSLQPGELSPAEHQRAAEAAVESSVPAS